MKLQKLTSKGMEGLQNDLEKIRRDDISNPIINIKKYETNGIDNIEIDENKKFNNKLSIGKYFLNVFATKEGEFHQDTDVEVWNWLSIVYYKQLLNSYGKIGELQRLFISKTFSYYPSSHLLKVPYDICKLYKNKLNEIQFILLDKSNKTGNLCRNVVKNQDVIKNSTFIEVARKFFYDEEGKSLKKEMSKKSILRLIKVWKQYERTFDMYRMSSEKIINELLCKHEEFDKFSKEIKRIRNVS